MKKWKGLLLSALLALALAGCGEEKVREPSETGGQEEEEEIVLTYATTYLDPFIKSQIEGFNYTHENCRIEVREYQGEGSYAKKIQRFNADLISDNPPDIVDISEINVLSFLSNGAFADLYPMMDADPGMDRSDFVPSVLKWYEIKGKLYAISLGYRIETMMGKESVVGSRADWTLKKVQELLKNLPEGSLLLNYGNGARFLSLGLRMSMDQFVDLETGECHFDSEGFRSLLETAGMMKGGHVDGNSADEEKCLQDGTLLLQNVFLDSLISYKREQDIFGGEAICIGFPSDQGGKAILNPFKSLAITERCKHKEQAWEFVASLLGDEFQGKRLTFNFPIRESSLKKRFQQAMEMEKGSALSSGKEISLPTQEDADNLYEIINSAEGLSGFVRDVLPIIQEEAAYYFDGAKTVDETVKVIQSRVSVYISTNY